MNDRVFISVIVPTCHRNESLAKCLNSLAPGNQTLEPDQYEVIVTDDGSKSTARQLIQREYSWVKWVEGPRKGPAANRNNGAIFSKGQWLAFTDDDCVPDNKWLEAYKAEASGDAGALEGAIEALGEFAGDLVECPVNIIGGNFWSANIALRKRLFFEIGAFDENYPIAANEDQDLYNRLGGSSSVPFVGGAIVRHPVRYANLITKLDPNRFLIAHRTWAYHVVKNKKYIGLNTLSDTAVYSLKCYARWLARSAINCHWRSAFLCLVEIIVGVPLTAYFQAAVRRKIKN